MLLDTYQTFTTTLLCYTDDSNLLALLSRAGLVLCFPQSCTVLAAALEVKQFLHHRPLRP